MTGRRFKRLPWSLFAYASLAACSVIPPAFYLMGPTWALQPTLCRTWSLGALGFFDLWERPEVMARASTLLPERESRAVTALSLFTAILVTLFLLGHRLFGRRFLLLACLACLPFVTIMPGPYDASRQPGLWLVVASQLLWWLAFLLAAVAALRTAPDLPGILWIVAVIACLAGLIEYPIGSSLAIALAGAAVLLARRRGRRKAVDALESVQ